MSVSLLLNLGLAALLPLAAARQPLRSHYNKRDDPYPFCDPATNPNCIDGGRYLVPILEFSNRDDKGDSAFNQYLPSHDYTLDPWSNGLWPEACQNWGVNADHFVASDFAVYNVTYPDQCEGSPWVICYHTRASESIDQVASVISRIPVRMRQALSTYMVYSEDNPQYNGAVATLAADGLIVGRSDYFFTTSLVHEHGHAVDSNLVGHGAPGTGSEFSTTDTWHNAVASDYCAVSAYGSGSYVEDFAETGRAVLLDNIYPGGLVAFSGNNPNITQIDNQVSVAHAQLDAFYQPGGSCDLTKKFPFPSLVAQN